MVEEENSSGIQEGGYSYSSVRSDNKDDKSLTPVETYDHNSQDPPYLQRQYHMVEGGTEPQPGPSLMQGVSMTYLHLFWDAFPNE